MRNSFKKFLTVYFNSWWLPIFVFLILLGSFTMTAVSRWKVLSILAIVLFLASVLGFSGIISASIWNLVKRRWAKGIVNMFFVFTSGVVTFFVFGFLLFVSMFGPSEDGFADNLKIPLNIEVVEPGKELETQFGTQRDAFQAVLLAALQTPGNEDTTISGSISALLQLQESHPAILWRYFASSPAWRVFNERGNVFATRRWMIGSQWCYSLHGYYSQYDIDRGSESFQSRFTIGLSGKPWWRGDKDTTWLRAGKTMKATLSTGNQMQESHCVISDEALVVEIFEQSKAPERRLTKAALGFLQTELQFLAENPSWETAVQILPPESIRKGNPSFEIRNSFQPGIYDSMIWLNPGESGMIYLKAFEVTKGTALSVERLKEASNERIGWSDDPEELFFSNTHFTIYEGDWGKPYAAQFEVWFESDSGGPERKLVERVFKIEGWQR